ncbi:hypothetical protein Tco_1075604 [Tanacetum coccineum]
MYGFKECSSCGALYNREHCCSNVSSVDNFVRDPNPISYDETPDSSQQPPRNCSKCGGPFGGLYCRQCTCERCRRNYTDEVCALCCYEVEKSFVNDSNPNSFIDSPNIFNPPPQPQTYSCEFCGNNAHYGYDCPPQVPFIYNLEPCYNQDFDNDFPQKKQHQPEDILELLHKLLKDLQSISEELADYFNTPNWNCPAFYDNDDEDDDEEYTIAITPVLPTVEPDNSLSIGDEHLSTIPEKKESRVEDLVPIPSESEGISDSMCDVPFWENSHPLDDLKDHYEIFFDPNDDYASSDDDPLYSEDIVYVDASPPDLELVSLEEVKDFDPENGEIDTDILLTIKDNILHEKLLNINLLIAKIEALKDNPTPSSDFVTKSPSTSPNSFLEETNISYNSLPDEPDSGDFTIDVVEDIFDNPTREPRVHVPNVLPTHPNLHLYSDFTLSIDSLRPDLIVSFPSGTRNKIFDPGIFIEVQSKRFLSPNEFSISFIRDPLFPVIDTLLPFSSENEDKVFNPGSLSLKEEKSPHLLSHRGFNTSKIIFDFSKSPMMIYGRDIPILDDCPDFEVSHAHGFVLRSLELQILSFIMGISYPNLIN